MNARSRRSRAGATGIAFVVGVLMAGCSQGNRTAALLPVGSPETGTATSQSPTAPSAPAPGAQGGQGGYLPASDAQAAALDDAAVQQALDEMGSDLSSADSSINTGEGDVPSN